MQFTYGLADTRGESYVVNSNIGIEEARIVIKHINHNEKRTEIGLHTHPLPLVVERRIRC